MKCAKCSRRHKFVTIDICRKCFADTLIWLWLIGEWQGGSDIELSNLVRSYLFDTRGEKCEICGWNEVNPSTGNIPVQVDHIDGNSSNHSHDNLKILCPNHHSLTSTYGYLNKGNGRRHRRKENLRGISSSG